MSNKLTILFSQLLANVPPDIILLIVALLIFLFVIIGSLHLLRVWRFTLRLIKETNEIKRSEEIDFDKMGDSLKELHPLIDEFEELVTDEKRNTQNCEIIISEDNVLRAIGVDEAALEHYPGIFTALGIAGTFIGILFVLVPIAGQVNQTDLVDRLLHGAGTAFLTSIIGIASSLIFLTIERKVIGAFKKHLYEFQMAINSKLVRVTTEGVLIEIKKAVREAIVDDLKWIRDAMEGMADDIGAAVSKSISDTLESVSKILDSSIATAGNSSQEIVSKVMDSIDGTLGVFSENLAKMEESSSIQSDILEQFDNSVKNTTILAEKLEEIVPSMTEIAKDFDASSQRLEKLPDALLGLTEMQEEFTTVAKESIELMNESWKTERERLTELTESLQQQFTSFEEGIVNGLQTTMSKFDDELSRAGTYVATWLDRLNDDVDGFTKQVSTFNGVVQNSSSDLQSILQEFNQTLSKQSSDMEANVASISSAMKSGFQEVEVGFKQLPPEIGKAVSGIEKIYKTASEQLPEMLSAHLDKMVIEMNKTTRKGFSRFWTK